MKSYSFVPSIDRPRACSVVFSDIGLLASLSILNSENSSVSSDSWTSRLAQAQFARRTDPRHWKFQPQLSRLDPAPQIFVSEQESHPAFVGRLPVEFSVKRSRDTPTSISFVDQFLMIRTSHDLKVEVHQNLTSTKLTIYISPTPLLIEIKDDSRGVTISSTLVTKGPVPDIHKVLAYLIEESIKSEQAELSRRKKQKTTDSVRKKMQVTAPPGGVQLPTSNLRSIIRIELVGLLIEPPLTFREGMGIISIDVRQTSGNMGRHGVFCGVSKFGDSNSPLACMGIDDFEGNHSLHDGQVIARKMLESGGKLSPESIPSCRQVREHFELTMEGLTIPILSNPSIREILTVSELLSLFGFQPDSLERILLSRSAWRVGHEVQ